MKNLKTKKQPIQRQPKKSSVIRPQTVADHINELRNRFFIVGVFFVIGGVLSYFFRRELLWLITRPLANEKLIYLTPGGGFSFIFQVLLYAALLFAAPVAVYQILAFIRPTLPKKTQRLVIYLTVLSTLLIIGAVIYAYLVAVPSALVFLTHFSEGTVTPSLTAESYLSFFMAYIGGLAAVSLLPVVLIVINSIHTLPPMSLLKGERWVIVGAFILAAIITPTPDAFNQAMIAGPIIAIYQVGFVSIMIIQYRSRAQLRRRVEHAKTASVSTRQPQQLSARKVAGATAASTASLRGASLHSPITIDHAARHHVPSFTTETKHAKHAPQVKRTLDGFVVTTPTVVKKVPRGSLAMPRRPAVPSTPPRQVFSRPNLSINGFV